MKRMRQYHDFDQQVKFIGRSFKDKELKKEFDLEVIRGANHFVNWLKRGDSVETAHVKIQGSYGTIISSMVLVHLFKAVKG